MDGLALLCNLFADGPVTLRRLRLAGVADLAELGRTPPPTLAEWLHASLPQAQAFAEEARALLHRLAEESAPRAVPSASRVPAPRVPARSAPRAEPIAPGAPLAPASSALPLAAGLLSGLDSALCERLALHHVRTVQALSEFAGLALARRTGIPYSTLLELARQARRFVAAGARAPAASASDQLAPPPSRVDATRTVTPSAARPESLAIEPRTVESRTVELRPFDARAKRAPAERELARTDEFTLPLVEPESAGPFG